jgi:hypothetical protein
MAFKIPRFNRAARVSELMDKKLVDRHLERMDAHGISRRDFVQVVSGGIAAGAAAELMGVPVSAYASENGKIAYMYFSATLEYCRTVSKSVQDTASALGARSVSLDAEFNSNKEYDQFQQLQVAGDLGGIILNPPDASNIKRIAEDCQKNKIWMGNVWATLPWYTPFDAGEYFTYMPVQTTSTRQRASQANFCLSSGRRARKVRSLPSMAFLAS